MEFTEFCGQKFIISNRKESTSCESNISHNYRDISKKKKMFWQADKEMHIRILRQEILCRISTTCVTTVATIKKFYK